MVEHWPSTCEALVQSLLQPSESVWASRDEGGGRHAGVKATAERQGEGRGAHGCVCVCGTQRRGVGEG